MTYCVGVLVDKGVVLASDSRTNAGVDNVSVFCKMELFEGAPDRWLGAVCSGHLGITQAVLARIAADAAIGSEPNWRSAGGMREVAGMFGRALRQARDEQSHLMSSGVDTAANFILGGQMPGEPPRLFLVYAQGNFIEAQDGTRFFQIGEAKYGKPMLDRVVEAGMGLGELSKCVLLSYDATLRSNLSVGPPIDLAAYAGWSYAPARRWRFVEGDSYFESLRARWGVSLREAFAGLPPPSV